MAAPGSSSGPSLNGPCPRSERGRRLARRARRVLTSPIDLSLSLLGGEGRRRMSCISDRAVLRVIRCSHHGARRCATAPPAPRLRAVRTRGALSSLAAVGPPILGRRCVKVLLVGHHSLLPAPPGEGRGPPSSQVLADPQGDRPNGIRWEYLASLTLRDARVTRGSRTCLTWPATSLSTHRVAGAGQALDGATRRPLERSFGTDLSDVRIHSHRSSDAASRTIGARAFTSGNQLSFALGAYRPNEPDGQRLLAHELAHVVQQRGGTGNASGPATDPEADADRAAAAATAPVCPRLCTPTVRERFGEAATSAPCPSPTATPAGCLTRS